MNKNIITHSDGMGVHAGRSVIDRAEEYTNEGKAVCEYIKNSWQYTDDHTKVEIFVDQENKSIQIKDTSSGMSIETLNNQFFVLHQRNIDRVRGKDGRGEHGTGKVAALGIGKVLRVKTIHNKLLNEFEIHRADCDLEKSLKKVPIRWNAQNKKVNLPNGTTVEILKWRYKRQISIKSIKEFIQRKAFPEKDAYTHEENGKLIKTKIDVFLQSDIVEEEQIPFSREKKIELKDEEIKYFGKMNFVIKVADRKLSSDERGIRIFAKGIYKAFIKNPTASKNEFIFGDCNCDSLSNETDPPIFAGSSRREEINRDSELGSKFEDFVILNVDILRKELEKEDNERRKKEKDEITKKEEEKMKDFFNSAFKEEQLDFEKKIVLARGNIDKKDNYVPELGETKIIVGKDFNVKVVDGDEGSNILDVPPTPYTDTPINDPDPRPGSGKLEKVPEDSEKRGKERKSKKKSSGGGFNFKYDHIGSAAERADYDEENRLITVNLSHPFIAKLYEACGKDTSAPKFRRAAYEAATFEFAAAVTVMKARSHLADDLVDGVTDMQKLVDKVLRKMADLDLFDD